MSEETDILESVRVRFAAMPGKVGFYYKNLTTGETAGYKETETFLAASIIKLPLLAAMLLLKSQGRLDFSERINIPESAKVPGAGAVQHLTEPLELDIMSLAKLMITISDNTAFNVLLDRCGIEETRRALREMGMQKTDIGRKLYDAKAEAAGIKNVFTPQEMGVLLEKIYRRRLISEDSSGFIERLLLQQQVDHKIPSLLPASMPSANKTGEEDGTTHDIGIVYASEPFVICFASNETDVPQFESLIRRIAGQLASSISK